MVQSLEPHPVLAEQGLKSREKFGSRQDSTLTERYTILKQACREIRGNKSQQHFRVPCQSPNKKAITRPRINLSILGDCGQNWKPILNNNFDGSSLFRSISERIKLFHIYAFLSSISRIKQSYTSHSINLKVISTFLWNIASQAKIYGCQYFFFMCDILLFVSSTSFFIFKYFYLYVRKKVLVVRANFPLFRTMQRSSCREGIVKSSFYR